ncbi:MAG: flagellar biosynthesis protein FlhB [Deltaproteobacteria bacterium]|nr:flagellar biosynthesis protein FlhB [Deltaproteobacteria bacterium]
MADEHAQERTEEATPKRREEARKKGQVPRGRELGVAAALGGGLLALAFLGGTVLQGLMAVARQYLAEAGTMPLSVEQAQTLAIGLLWALAPVIAPFLAAGVGAGAVMALVQGGPVLTLHPLQPRFEALNPLAGLKRLVSLRMLRDLVKALLKVTLIGYVAYAVIRDEAPRLPMLMGMDVAQVLAHTAGAGLRLCLRAGLVLGVLALLDYAAERWEHERRLRMSREEVREEFKEREGDPLVKGRIKTIQRSLARKRMMAAVPKADVVLTNPEHVAVALRYDRGRMRAPVVVAKGAELLAQEIRRIAREHHIPILERRDLARALYAGVEIGREIPMALYEAVAEVLAFVYRLKGVVR